MSNTIAHTSSNPNSVIVTRTSPFSGKTNQMEIPLSPTAFRNAYRAWQGGALVQDAFSTLTADEREFIKTGITPREWDAAFGED